MDVPETRYALDGDVHVAYQVLGSGPLDIVHVSNWVWSVDLVWDTPQASSWLRGLSEIGRVIQFDMPGTGSSDPLPGDRPITLEDWMDTVGVVLDAQGIERAALVAQDFGAMMAMLFAAAHPERVSSLVLFGTTARLKAAPDYPIGFPDEVNARGLQWWLDIWGTGAQIKLTYPSIAGDPEMMRLQGRWERLTVSPGTARKVFALLPELDVRSVLESIRVPTLVMHRRGDRWMPVSHGRYVAEHIPEAKYVEVPGEDHFPFGGNSELLLREIREFLGAASREKPDETGRALASVLFTDIVASTERAAALGDRRWRDLLDGHDRMVRTALDRFSGREIKTMGDGILATFDGPGKAINCARSIREGAARLGVQIRAGLHIGEVEMRGEDIGGLAVHIASRVMSNAGADEILVSSTMKDLVIGSGIEFEGRGARELKGVPGTWNLYAVAS